MRDQTFARQPTGNFNNGREVIFDFRLASSGPYGTALWPPPGTPPAAPRRLGLQRAANGNITLDFPSATNRSYRIAYGNTPGSFAQAAVLPGTCGRRRERRIKQAV